MRFFRAHLCCVLLKFWPDNVQQVTHSDSFHQSSSVLHSVLVCWTFSRLFYQQPGERLNGWLSDGNHIFVCDVSSTAAQMMSGQELLAWCIQTTSWLRFQFNLDTYQKIFTGRMMVSGPHAKKWTCSNPFSPYSGLNPRILISFFPLKILTLILHLNFDHRILALNSKSWR